MNNCRRRDEKFDENPKSEVFIFNRSVNCSLSQCFLRGHLSQLCSESDRMFSSSRKHKRKSSSSSASSVDLNRTRSLNDHKEYRLIKLDNGLECLLICADKTPHPHNPHPPHKHGRESGHFAPTTATSPDRRTSRRISQQQLTPIIERRKDDKKVQSLRLRPLSVQAAEQIEQQQQQLGAPVDIPRRTRTPSSSHHRPLSISGGVGARTSGRVPPLLNSKSSPTLLCTGHDHRPTLADINEAPALIDPHLRSNRIATVSMAVGVGSFSEPRSCQGLAHFLEHMVFMGSEKYPEENQFDKFISQNGGTSNAYTDSERTVYYFSCFQKDLLKALDIFAQFFISPLLLKDSADRELKSIESEFSIRQNLDERRLFEIWRHCARKGTPYSKFCCGNLQTLKHDPVTNNVDIYEELRKFHDRYYIGPNMRLVIVGYESLDALEGMVMDLFKDVCDGNSPECTKVPSIEGHGAMWRTGDREVALRLRQQNIWDGILQADLSASENEHEIGSDGVVLGCLCRVVPIADVHQISLAWQLPPKSDNYNEYCGAEYIAHLLGHESDGSVLAELKNRGWATELNSSYSATQGGFEGTTGCSVLSVQIQLTLQGLHDWVCVVGLIFEYIGMLKKCGCDEWIFEEARTLNSIKYRYKEEEDYVEYATNLAVRMLPQWDISKRWLLDMFTDVKFDPEMVQEALNHLRPELLRLDMLSSLFWPNQSEFIVEMFEDLFDFTGSKKVVEPYTDCQYWVSRIDPNTLRLWNNLLDGVMAVVFDDEAMDDPEFEATRGASLFLPKRNPYVPSDFTVLAAASGKKNNVERGLLVNKTITVQRHYSTFNTPVFNGSFDSSKLLMSFLSGAGQQKKVLQEFVKEDSAASKKISWLPGEVVEHDVSLGRLLVSFGGGLLQWHEMSEPEKMLGTLPKIFFLENGSKAKFIDTTSQDAILGKKPSSRSRTLSNSKRRLFRTLGRSSTKPAEVLLKKGDPNIDDKMDPKIREGIWESFPASPTGEGADQVPALLPGSSDLLRVFFMSDKVNLVPKTECYVRILSPLPSTLPLFAALNDFMCILLEEILRDESYLAHLADLELDIGTNNEGLTIHVSGFSQMIPKFLDRIIAKLFEIGKGSVKFGEGSGFGEKYFFGLNQRAFMAQLEALAQEYSNEASHFQSEGPISNALYKILVSGSWHPETLAEATDYISGNTEVADYCGLMLRRCRVEALIAGNVDYESASDIMTMISEHLLDIGSKPLSDMTLPRLHIPQVPVCRYNPDKSDPWQSVTGMVHVLEALDFPGHSVDLYFQLGPDNLETRLLAGVIEAFMKEPIYADLRSRQQVGYMVQCSTTTVLGMVGFLIEVTSDNHPPHELAAIVDDFLVRFRTTLAELEPEVFHENVCGFARSKLDRGSGMKQEADRLWESITLYRYRVPPSFEWKSSVDEIEGLKTWMSLKTLLRAYDRWLLPTSSERRRVSVLVCGTSFPLSDGLSELHKRKKYVQVVDTDYIYKKSSCAPMDCVSFDSGKSLTGHTNLDSPSSDNNSSCVVM